MNLRRYCVVCFFVFCGMVVVLLFLSLISSTSDGPAETFIGCPRITPCDEVKPLSGLSFDQKKKASRPAPKVSSTGEDSVTFDKEIKICVLYMIHKVKKERETSFTFYFNKERHIYDIVHVYATNDDYPKDGREGFIVFPEYADYHTLLKKVWFGLSYFRDKNCDYVLKMDDDITLDFLSISYRLSPGNTKNGANSASWIGRYQPEGREANVDPNAKWNAVPYVKYTGRNKYTDFMYGMFYGYGRDLYDCIIKEVDGRLEKEVNAEVKFTDLHLEDVGMGFIVNNCKNIPGYGMSRFHIYYGEHLWKVKEIDYMGLTVWHWKLPERKTTDPIWMVI